MKRTNNPWKDNWDRAHAKRLAQTSKESMVVRGDNGARLPRKRKKYIYRIERKNYAAIVDSVFWHKIREAGLSESYYTRLKVPATVKRVRKSPVERVG